MSADGARIGGRHDEGWLVALIRSLACAPVLLVLIPGFIVAQWVAWRSVGMLSWQSHPFASVMAGALALASVACAVALARRARPLPPRTFLIATLLGGAVLRMLYVLWLDPAWVSDFSSYWRTAGVMLEHDAIDVRDVYEQRALYIAYPVRWLFGDQRTALELFNVSIGVLIQLVGYDLLRRSAGHAPAQSFAIAWLAAAEPMLVLAMPNHDLLALLFIAMAVWLGVVGRLSANGSLRRAALTGLAAGCVVTLLDGVRGIGAVYLLSVLSFTGIALSLVWLRRQRQAADAATARRLGVHVVALCLGFFALHQCMSAAGLFMPERTANVMTLRYTTPHATSLSDGSYRFMRAFDNAFVLDLLDHPGELAAFRRSLVLSDLADAPLHRLAANARRMPQQYSLGTQYAFYLQDTPPAVDAAARAWNTFYLAAFALCVVVAAVRIVRRVDAFPVAGFLLLFGAILSTTLLLIGENQPRYMFPLWFVGAVALATGLARNAPAPSQPLARAAAIALGGAAACVAVLVAALALGFDPRNGRILRDWSFASEPGPASALQALQGEKSHLLKAPKSGRTLATAFGPLSLKLQLSAPPAVASRASASTRVCDLQHGSLLHFQYDMPAKSVAPTLFTLELRQDDVVLWHGTLPNSAGVERVRVPLRDGTACTTLTFRLSNPAPISSRTSWRHASFVEVFFPRIEPAASLSQP